MPSASRWGSLSDHSKHTSDSHGQHGSSKHQEEHSVKAGGTLAFSTLAGPLGRPFNAAYFKSLRPTTSTGPSASGSQTMHQRPVSSKHLIRPISQPVHDEPSLSQSEEPGHGLQATGMSHPNTFLPLSRPSTSQGLMSHGPGKCPRSCPCGHYGQMPLISNRADPDEVR
jgi:hypothetical protein